MPVLPPRDLRHAALLTALATSCLLQVPLVAVAAMLALTAGQGVRFTPVHAIVIVHGLFVGLFLASAWLFRRAARHAGTEPPRAP